MSRPLLAPLSPDALHPAHTATREQWVRAQAAAHAQGPASAAEDSAQTAMLVAPHAWLDHGQPVYRRPEQLEIASAPRPARVWRAPGRQGDVPPAAVLEASRRFPESAMRRVRRRLEEEPQPQRLPGPVAAELLQTPLANPHPPAHLAGVLDAPRRAPARRGLPCPRQRQTSPSEICLARLVAHASRSVQPAPSSALTSSAALDEQEARRTSR